MPWNTPTPISAAGDLPAFPLDTLPDWMAAQARNVADAICMVPDMAAMVGLTVVAVATGGRVAVSPRPGHVEPTNLYTLGVMDSGEGKSFVVGQMSRPVYTVEAELRRDAKGAIAEALQRKELAEQVAAEAKRRAVKAPGEERAAAAEEAVRAAQDAQDITVPATPLLVADDVTSEALASLMASHDGRMALISAEGGIFDAMQGRYSSTPNLDPYLKGHAGDPMRVHRSSGREEVIDRPALTVGLAVQPVVLETIGSNAAMLGRGLMARFLTYVPESRSGRRDWLAAPQLDEAVSAAYDQQMAAILGTVAPGNPFDERDVTVLRLTAEGTRAWMEFRQELEPLVADGGRLAGLRDWTNKLAGHTLRLAGVLHVAHTGGRRNHEPIPTDTVQAALRIGRWLIPHAVAAHEGLCPSGEQQLAKRVLRVLRAKLRPGTAFTKKQLFDQIRGQVARAEDLDRPLELLVELEWLAEVPYEDDDPHRRGRKRSPRFAANPALWADTTPSPVAAAA